MGVNALRLLAATGAQGDAVAAAVLATGPDADAATVAAAIDRGQDQTAAAARPPRPPAGVDAELITDGTETDSDDLGFSDAPPASPDLPRYALTDEPAAPDPEPAPLAPRPAAWERHVAQPDPQYLPLPEPEAGPEPVGPPWRDRLRGIDSGTARRAGLYGIGGIMLIAAIAGSFMVTGRGKPPEPAANLSASPTAKESSPVSDALAPEVVIRPATVSASCSGPADVVAPWSGDPSRAFVCNRLFGLDLQVANIVLPCPTAVTSIVVVPGHAREWSAHRLPSAITWRLGGQLHPQTIAPTRTGSRLTLPGGGVVATELSATITASDRPPTDDETETAGAAVDPTTVDATTAISRIEIRGRLGPGCPATATSGG